MPIMMSLVNRVEEGWHNVRVSRMARVKSEHPIFRFFLKTDSGFEVWTQVNLNRPEFSSDFVTAAQLTPNDDGKVDLEKLGGKELQVKLERQSTVENRTALIPIEFRASASGAETTDEIQF